MPSPDKRLTKLENIVQKHLEESGEIRGAIRTLEEKADVLMRAVEKISDKMWYALWALVLGTIGVIGFLLKVTLWR